MDQNDIGGDRLFAVRFGQGKLKNVVAGRQLHDIETIWQAGIMEKRGPVRGVGITGIGLP